MNRDKLKRTVEDIEATEQAIKEASRKRKAAYAEAAREFGLGEGEIAVLVVKHRRAMGRAPRGKVYFVGVPSRGALKIGHSTIPEARFSSLRSEIRAPIEIIGMIDGDEPEERALHHQFRDFRRHGEFFSWEPIRAEVMDLIARNSALLLEPPQ